VRAALFLVVVVLAACGARLDGGVAARPDAAVARNPDAAVDGTPDAPPMVADNACGVASDQGDLGMLAGAAGSQTQSSTTTQRVSFVDAVSPLTRDSATPDVVYVELWDGYGPFTGTAAQPGTFTIAGDDTDYDTCGVCVLMLADVANNTPTKLLLATSGTVTITSVGTATGQTTEATVTNASFVEISQVNNDYQPVVGSDCPSPISHVELRGTL
jgi:hypothetical protein